VGPGQKGGLVRPKRGLSRLPNSARKISAELRSSFRERYLGNIFSAAASVSAQREKPGSLGASQLLGGWEGGPRPSGAFSQEQA